MKRRITKLRDIGQDTDDPLVNFACQDLMPLPFPCDDKAGDESPLSPLSETQRSTYEYSLDGVSAIAIPKPKNKEEEKRLVERFLSGLRKLLSQKENWTFWQPLMIALDNCVRCQTCSEACPVYLASGKKEIYRPTYRSEVLRRIINRYIKGRNRTLSWLTGGDIELNWKTVARLGELAYRCTLCRRCAQWCPLGSDNALIARELRKLFSQEMGVAPKEIHELGSVQHLNTGASTGMTPEAFKEIIQFMEDESEDKTGQRLKVPVDKEGSDILLVHNSGEYLSWLENPLAYAIIFERAGLNWTLSSELFGYEATNYGVWYDDVQFARIALRQIEVARRLKVKCIIVGECGHAHKALTVIADRILIGEMNIPRGSVLPLLEDLVDNGRLNLDPRKNNFPVTLHDPCNIVRMMGIVEPQRKILKKICPQFREMEPHGVENYCCGGGSGFAIMSRKNFQDWRISISGRMKIKQMLDVFQDVIPPSVKKYVCAPCSNCKGQLRDLLNSYGLRERSGIFYGGLAELIVNAMVDIKKPFIEWG